MKEKLKSKSIEPKSKKREAMTALQRRRATYKKTLIILWVVICSTLVTAADYEEKIRDYDQTIEKKNKEFNNLKYKIKSQEGVYRNAELKEISLTRELKQLDFDLNSTQLNLEKLQLELEQTETDIPPLRVELEKTEAQLNVLTEVLGGRLRVMYKQGRLNRLEMILASDGLSAFIRMAKYINSVVEYDTDIFYRIHKKRDRLAEKERLLEEKLAKISQLRLATEKNGSTIKKQRARKEKLLVQIHSKKETYEKSIGELSEVSLNMENFLNGLMSERNEVEEVFLGNLEFDEKQGKLYWPVYGKLVARFGLNKNSKFNVYVPNHGIDIKAPMGENVLAVSEGRVEYAGWHSGYGQVVIVNHGGDYRTLYAHAYKILVREGDRVEQKQVIAKVGDTGSLLGSSLHFEIRKGSQAVDPLEWLRKGG